MPLDGESPLGSGRIAPDENAAVQFAYSCGSGLSSFGNSS
jgi:hypothetical protein